jgi:hypothetical protein
MPAKSDDALQKVTLNLYEADVKALEAYYGHGWSEQVRQVVHQHVATTTSFHRLRKTLGDLE